MDSGLDVLGAQIAKGLNSAMSGFPFRGPDVGGHYSSLTTEDHIVTGDYTFTGGQTRSDEVYLRWVQCYAFSSIMWAHGHPWRSKLPWIRGPRVEAIVRRYIELRYRLIPYIYTLARRACTTGAPFVRALVLDYPEDANAYALGSEFLLGHDLLIAPVLEEGATTWDVYLPQGQGSISGHTDGMRAGEPSARRLTSRRPWWLGVRPTGRLLRKMATGTSRQRSGHCLSTSGLEPSFQWGR